MLYLRVGIILTRGNHASFHLEERFGSIKLVKPRNLLLLMCMCHDQNVSGHVFVC
jgi:hypothetical protein